MTGSTEHTEHRFDAGEGSYTSVDDVFQRQRTEVFERILDVVGPDLPVLVADFPQVAVGLFATQDMLEPARLDALNAQVADWHDRYAQVERLNYTRILEQREAELGSIRTDGVHTDLQPIEDLARDVLVEELIALVN